VLAFAVMITLNSLANMLPINGKTTAELSDQYPNLFVPAGITFSIWGIIYLLLLSVMIIQFISKWSLEMESLRWSVAANFLLNALWIVAWHYEKVILSLMIMIALLGTLVNINQQLQDRSSWPLKLTFGVYLGWICLATIANATALLVAIPWDGFGIAQETWTLLLIGVGAAVGAVAMLRLKNPFLSLALIWGFYGIVLKRKVDHPSIAVASYVGMVVILVAGLYLVLKSRRIVGTKSA